MSVSPLPAVSLAAVPRRRLATLELAKFFYETRDAIGGIVALPQLDGGVIRAQVMQILLDADLPVRPYNITRLTYGGC